MKNYLGKIFVKTGTALTVMLVLLTALSVPAAKIKLSNGTTFNGKLVSQNINYVILEIGGTKVSIAKNMIVSAEGLPPGVTINNTAAPEPAPAPAQPKAVTQPVPPVQAPPAEEKGAAPDQNQPVEITLKNGAKFKGTIVSETGNMITLQNENGSRVNIYKNIIASIPGRDLSAPAAPAPQPPASAPAPSAEMAQQQTPAASADPAVPAAAPAVPPAAAAPAAISPSPALQQTSAPASALPVVPPVVIAPAATPSPSGAVQTTQTTPPPAVAVPVKRGDGRRELLLKNGTVFIGKIISENDRFLSFGTSEGTTVNILKRLIRKLDGIPYVVQMAAASPLDTSSQLKRTTTAGAEGEKTDAAAPPAEVKPAVIKRRLMPNIAIKPGVSMAELMDSLKSNFGDQRAVSARQIGTMGQWATGAIGALAALLGDTAGSRELPPLETDSASMEKMLPPGFEAARALCRIGPKGIEELKRGTGNGNPLVRQRSVFGCSETQEVGMLPVFQAALKDGDPRVRAMAVRGLRFHEAKDILVNALADLDGDVRTIAASTLGDVRNPGAVKSLIAALKDVKPSVRTQAAISLARIGAKEAIAPVAELAGDIETPVRETAVMALGMLKDTASTPPLLLAMADPNPTVRTAAVKSLAALYDPRAIPSLYTAMQEKNDAVRTAVELAIKQLTEIPLLIGALDNESSFVRENIAYILWLMTGADLGQDKKAWTEWYADQGKTPKKTEQKTMEEKKAEEKKK